MAILPEISDFNDAPSFWTKSLLDVPIQPKGDADCVRPTRPRREEAAMQISTTRFGQIEVDPLDILLFPCGLFGFEQSKHFVLLGDEREPAIVWLQSTSDPAVAFIAISPRRCVRDYRLRVAQSDLALVLQEDDDQTFVLALASKGDNGWTLNLRAPIVINPQRRLGKQIVTLDEQPIQFALKGFIGSLRKTA
jgi:flagellar assembly factor FliW